MQHENLTWTDHALARWVERFPRACRHATLATARVATRSEEDRILAHMTSSQGRRKARKENVFLYQELLGAVFVVDKKSARIVTTYQTGRV